jgi:Arc/MetJ-type ribon-helix-helix transcriptional regulator
MSKELFMAYVAACALVMDEATRSGDFEDVSDVIEEIRKLREQREGR